jgi:3D (Asp-Asp-Asp) domain-containing protein
MNVFEKIRESIYGSKMTICAGLAAAAMLTVGAGSVKHVAVFVDGQEMRLTTMHSQPEKIISEAGVAMDKFDEYRMSTLRVKDDTEIHIVRAVPVELEMGGTVREMKTARTTVGRLLDELGVDRKKYKPSLNEDVPIRTGLHIKLRTPEEIAAEEAQEKEVQQVLEQMPQLRDGYLETAHGTVRYTNVMVMEASAYLPTDGGGSCITATGLPATYGVVAVDPDVIPLGTQVYIPGYGVAIAADTGGMIEGAMIDLCMEDYDECMEFGRRDIDVYILET